jgi:hypothetical protein
MRGLETISEPAGRVEEGGIGDGWGVWAEGLLAVPFWSWAFVVKGERRVLVLVLEVDV